VAASWPVLRAARGRRPRGRATSAGYGCRNHTGGRAAPVDRFTGSGTRPRSARRA